MDSLHGEGMTLAKRTQYALCNVPERYGVRFSGPNILIFYEVNILMHHKIVSIVILAIGKNIFNLGFLINFSHSLDSSNLTYVTCLLLE